MILLYIIFFIVVFSWFTLRRFFVVYTVEQKSMIPTLYEGDRVLAFRPWPFCCLRRDQIVIVLPGQLNEPKEDLSSESDIEPKNNHITKENGYIEPCIKRVTGLPGDNIESQLSDFDKLNQLKLKVNYDSKGKPIWSIPPNYFFVQGDSIYSTDSRHWGPIPSNHLLGVVIMKLTHE